MATAFSLSSFADAEPIDRARAVAEGVPVAALRQLTADHVLSMADVARVVAPRRTIDRRLRQGGRLSREESDRLARLVAIIALAERIFGSKKEAVAWLDTPKRVFDDQVPLDLLQTETGGRLVESHLLRALHGFFA